MSAEVEKTSQTAVEQLKKLQTFKDLGSTELIKHLDTLSSFTLYSIDANTRSVISDRLIDNGLVTFYKSMFDSLFKESLFSLETNQARAALRNLTKIRSIFWNLSDSSVNLCNQFLTSGLYVHVFKWLDSDILDPQTNSHSSEYKTKSNDFAKGLLGTLHNMVRLTTVKVCLDSGEEADVIQSFRKVDAVRICAKYLSTSLNTRIRCKGLFVLVYIIDESENGIVNSDKSNIRFMLTIIDDALTKPDHASRTYGYNVEETVEGLNMLAKVNEMNKDKIMSSGALRYYKSLIIGGAINQKETVLALNGVWQLSFREACCKTVREDQELKTAIEKHSDNKDIEVKKAAKGILWLLNQMQIFKALDSESNDKSLQNSTEKPRSRINQKLIAARQQRRIQRIKKVEDKQSKTLDSGVEEKQESEETEEKTDSDAIGHVMLSYQWDSQQLVIALRDRLRSAGYKVWMDIEQMVRSTLDCMAEAVDNSAVVLLGMTHKYKNSPNCRLEAEYAFKQNIGFIPLRLQPSYNSDGWLGMLTGTRVYYDLTNRDTFDDTFKRLINEIGDRGKIGAKPGGDTAIMKAKEVAPLEKLPLPTTPLHASNTPTVSTTPVQSAKQPTGRDEVDTSRTKDNELLTWDSNRVAEWLNKNEMSHLCKQFTSFNGKHLAGIIEIHRNAPEFFYSALRTDFKLTLKDISLFAIAVKQLHFS